MADILNFADYYVYRKSELIPHIKFETRKAGVKPERQGSLDGLCGIYCVINAINYTVRLSQKQRDGLFKQLIRVVNKCYSVDKCILHGTNKKLLLSMFQSAQNYLRKKYNIAIEITPMFKPRTKLHKKHYITALADFFDGNNKVIIIGLAGIHEHWTCIKEVTPKTIKLLDSDGLSYLKTSNCRISRKTNKKHHFLTPSSTWCVRLND